jgi:hypothetical protein
VFVVVSSSINGVEFRALMTIKFINFKSTYLIDYRLVRQRKEYIMHVLSKSLSNRYIIMHLNFKYRYLMLLIAPNLRPYGFSVLILLTDYGVYDFYFPFTPI